MSKSDNYDGFVDNAVDNAIKEVLSHYDEYCTPKFMRKLEAMNAWPLYNEMEAAVVYARWLKERGIAPTAEALGYMFRYPRSHDHIYKMYLDPDADGAALLAKAADENADFYDTRYWDSYSSLAPATRVEIMISKAGIDVSFGMLNFPTVIENKVDGGRFYYAAYRRFRRMRIKYEIAVMERGDGESFLPSAPSASREIIPEETGSLGVFASGEKIWVSSRDVAEKFEKNHRDVMRSIKMQDCSDDFNARNFALVEYRDAKGEARPQYLMTRDGFTFLAMGFTGAKAARFKELYIAEFNRMEEELYKKRYALPGGMSRYREEELMIVIQKQGKAAQTAMTTASRARKSELALRRRLDAALDLIAELKEKDKG